MASSHCATSPQPACVVLAVQEFMLHGLREVPLSRLQMQALLRVQIRYVSSSLWLKHIMLSALRVSCRVTELARRGPVLPMCLKLPALF